MIIYLLLWAAIFLAYFFYQRFVKPLNYWQKQNVPQGNPVWCVGHNTNLFLRNRSLPEQSQYIYNQSPGKRYMGIYDYTRPRLLLRDPELIKQMNVKDFEHFSDRPVFIPPKIEPIWSRNLFALNGIKWRKMRSILSPSFTSSKMKVIYTLIQDCSESFIQYFNQKEQDVIEVGMKDIFTRFTNDVIATSAFGIKTDSLRNPNNEFYIMGRGLLKIGGLTFIIKSLVTKLIPFLGVFFSKAIFDQKAMNFFYTTIDETVNTREKQNIIRPDMIHLLIEARKGINQKQEKDVIDTGFATVQETITETNSQDEMTLTNLDITAQAVVFFFAGFDTVSSLLMFMAYELAVNPDIQNKLRDEILQTRDECKEKLTYETLMKMNYMDMVVSETLRKWPNVHVLQRMCSKPYTIQPVLPGETAVHIETGAQILIPVFAIHRDPKYYPNPEKFDPERFNDENKKYINPYKFMPFGVGPRICIGSRMALLEGKLMFYHLLLNFEIVPVEATQIPPKLDPMAVRFEVQGDIYLGFKRIKK